MIEPIVRLARSGQGVTADGRHAPFSAPGDGLAIDGSVVPGPHRRTPPCALFPECGGCQLQHVDDESYAAYVVQRIRGALDSQKVAMPPLGPVHLSPPRTRRRASLKAERKGRVVRLGFNAPESHRIVDMTECHVIAPELFALVAPLRRLLGTLLADRKTAAVQMTIADQGIDIGLEGIVADDLARIEALTSFAADHALARLTLDEGQGAETRWEPEAATVTFGGVPVALPPGGFLQATADGEAALLAAVRDAIGDAALVADLFAGLGTFALPLSAGAKVYAAEGDRAAAAALKAAAARAGRAVFPEYRDLFLRPLSIAELDRFEAVVIDPPRAGAREQMANLAASRLGRLAYVSCNPATFARDAAILIGGGWRLEHITPVGQFRWSSHVELAATFRR